LVIFVHHFTAVFPETLLFIWDLNWNRTFIMIQIEN
jgi:hypothetical protein